MKIGDTVRLISLEEAINNKYIHKVGPNYRFFNVIYNPGFNSFMLEYLNNNYEIEVFGIAIVYLKGCYWTWPIEMIRSILDLHKLKII